MRTLRQRNGQSIIEFALVLPIILALVLAFTDLGRVIYFYSSVNNAVREAARYGSVTLISTGENWEDWVDEIKQKAVEFSIATPLNFTDIKVSCDLDELDQVIPCDDYITVSATVSIDPIVPFISEVIGFGSEYTISAESTMQMTPYGRYHE